MTETQLAQLSNPNYLADYKLIRRPRARAGGGVDAGGQRARRRVRPQGAGHPKRDVCGEGLELNAAGPPNARSEPAATEESRAFYRKERTTWRENASCRKA